MLSNRLEPAVGNLAKSRTQFGNWPTMDAVPGMFSRVFNSSIIGILGLRVLHSNSIFSTKSRDSRAGRRLTVAHVLGTSLFSERTTILLTVFSNAGDVGVRYDPRGRCASADCSIGLFAAPPPTRENPPSSLFCGTAIASFHLLMELLPAIDKTISKIWSSVK